MTEPHEPTILPAPPPSAPAADAQPGLLPAIALGLAVLLIVAAGITGVAMSMNGGTHSMMWGGSDAAGASRIEPTGFSLDGLPAHMVEHYTFARANADLYAQVPCFCGCQEMLGHRDLAQCFVTPDGAWESHASGCQVCIDESQMLMRMTDRGMGPEMMRDRIVSEFGGPMMGTSG